METIDPPAGIWITWHIARLIELDALPSNGWRVIDEYAWPGFVRTIFNVPFRTCLERRQKMGCWILSAKVLLVDAFQNFHPIWTIDTFPVYFSHWAHSWCEWSVSSTSTQAATEIEMRWAENALNFARASFVLLTLEAEGRWEMLKG